MFSPDFWKFLQVVRGGVADKADWTMNCNPGKCAGGCVYCSANALKHIRGKKVQRGCEEVKLRRTNRRSYQSLKNAVKYINPGDVVQVPSSHDITSKKMAKKLARAIRVVLTHTGATVIIHSKMSLDVAEVISEELYPFHKHNLIIQITIGTTDAKLMRAIEPKAPSFQERLAALTLLYTLGFNTSVSCTPALSTDVEELYKMVAPYIRARFHVGSLRLKGRDFRENVAINSFHRAYGKDAPFTKVHRGDRQLRVLLSDWLYDYHNRFDERWARRMLTLEKRYKKVICERDVYELAGTEGSFVAPLYTIQEAL